MTQETYIKKDKKGNEDTFIEYAQTIMPLKTKEFMSEITVKPPVPNATLNANLSSTYKTLHDMSNQKAFKSALEIEEITSDTYKRVIKDGLAEFLGKQVYMNEYGALENMNVPMTNWKLYNNTNDWRQHNNSLSSLERAAEALIEGNHVTGIRVYGYKLNAFGNNITQLTELQELHLCNNSLNELPEQLSKLNSLTTLIVYSNGINQLPKTLGRMESLKTLRLDNNPLTEISGIICQLTNLEELSMAFNHLKTIPKEVKYLTKLKTLNLNNNEIRKIPPEITELSELNELYLNNNKLSLAKDIEVLTRMQCKITLEGNMLTPFTKSLIEQNNHAY